MTAAVDGAVKGGPCRRVAHARARQFRQRLMALVRQLLLSLVDRAPLRPGTILRPDGRRSLPVLYCGRIIQGHSV